MMRTIFAAMVMLALVGCAPAAPAPAVGGCCKTADGCASGDNVDEDACKELAGSWNPGTECNTDTGVCE